MNFSTLPFLYGFLPLAAVLFLLLSRFGRRWSIGFLLAASLLFYAVGQIKTIPILLLSLAANYWISAIMVKEGVSEALRKILLVTGVALNICLLCFFKYISPNSAFATTFITPLFGDYVFPLALSFYSFSLIAYLIEIYRKEIPLPRVQDYLCFVLFFPKLVAGPIARPSEFLPQLNSPTFGRLSKITLETAVVLFVVGLSKKVLIADQLAPYVANAFDAQASDIGFYQAWTGILAYSFQLYFDFSGYSDMAIAVALLFGIRLPINFDGPYLAPSITEFWRRWHISLSFFFRDYVYIALLGGNRHGEVRKMANLLLVMVLCGAWHGSGWMFLLWGGMHGGLLVLHNLWRKLLSHLGAVDGGLVRRVCGVFLTFICVTLAWVPFRAESLGRAETMMRALLQIPSTLPATEDWKLLGALLIPAIIVWFFPRSYRFAGYLVVTENSVPTLTPKALTAPGRWNFFRGIFLGTLAVASIILLSQATDFIYRYF